MLDAEIIESLRQAVTAVVDKKGFHIAVLDVSELTSLADAFVLCSGAQYRQVGAMADEVSRRLRSAGRRPLHVEGERRSEWYLLDYGDFVVHLFTEDKRGFYALDSLWADAPRLSDEELGLQDRAAADDGSC